jgi:hypothetical protein
MAVYLFVVRILDSIKAILSNVNFKEALTYLY